MHDDILRELELAGTEVHARTLLVCSFAWRAPNSADHEWKSLDLARFVSRAFASIFTSYSLCHQTSHTYSHRYSCTNSFRQTRIPVTALSDFAHHDYVSLVMDLAALSRARLYRSL